MQGEVGEWGEEGECSDVYNLLRNESKQDVLMDGKRDGYIRNKASRVKCSLRIRLFTAKFFQLYV